MQVPGMLRGQRSKDDSIHDQQPTFPFSIQRSFKSKQPELKAKIEQLMTVSSHGIPCQQLLNEVSATGGQINRRSISELRGAHRQQGDAGVNYALLRSLGIWGDHLLEENVRSRVKGEDESDLLL